ncbi:MAG: ferrochelatase [Mariprofundaceae bacterium]
MKAVNAMQETQAPNPVGVLLVNLGTPDSPSVKDVRTYLREFLSDTRVVQVPRLIWWVILNLLILRTRPKQSALAYSQVWTDEGSPLLVIGKKQLESLRQSLNGQADQDVHIELGMRYGTPSIQAGLESLRDKGCHRILIFPLYPQYAASSSGTVFDTVGDVFKQWWWVPEIRTVGTYFDDTGYIEALAASVREHWETHGQADRLLMSFHGLPQRVIKLGDPYRDQCETAANLLAKKLDLKSDEWLMSFQSRFGAEEWVKPYTSETLEAWGKDNVEKVDVLCPGFSADCLETLEEIAVENRKVFENAGGGKMRYIPALNDRADHIDALLGLIRKHTCGWIKIKQRT